MRLDPNAPGYLDALLGRAGPWWQGYAIGGTICVVALIILSLLAVA